MTERILKWKDNKTPESSVYGDIYFSPENGMEESQIVFLDGINAPDIWKNRTEFVIGELGFGTGLNFFNTAKLWLETTNHGQKLHYISTEKHPLSSDDIDKAIRWPELAPIVGDFLKFYPDRKISLYDGRITLEILVGDSFENISAYEREMDAWYLDGFDPRKNPDMWSEDLLSEVARLSKQGTRIATFTAAGFVRRSLIENGFQMYKRKGYGKKREMIAGTYGNISGE